MAIQFSWRFPQLHCHTNLSGKQNVVYAVSWAYVGDDGAGHTDAITGERDVKPYVDDVAFVELGDLTKEIVEGWISDIFSAEEIAGMQAHLALTVSEKANPTRVIYNVNL